MVGGSIATSFSFIFSYIFMFGASYKLTKIQPLRWNYLKSIIAGVISFLIIFYITKLIENITFIPFVLLSILFLIIYFILVYLFRGLDKDDKGIIKSFYLRTKKLKIF